MARTIKNVKLTDNTQLGADELPIVLHPEVNMWKIMNVIYPIGSIYISTNSTHPNTLFGGTWEECSQGRVLIGAGTGTDEENRQKTFTSGATGGEYEHYLTVHEMPSHNHNGKYPGAISKLFMQRTL